MAQADDAEGLAFERVDRGALPMTRLLLGLHARPSSSEIQHGENDVLGKRDGVNARGVGNQDRSLHKSQSPYPLADAGATVLLDGARSGE